MRNKICLSLAPVLLALFLASCAGNVAVQPDDGSNVAVQPDDGSNIGVQPDAVSRLTKEQAAQDLVNEAKTALVCERKQVAFNSFSIDTRDNKRITAVKLVGPGFWVTDESGKIHKFLFDLLPLKTERGELFHYWIHSQPSSLYFGQRSHVQGFLNALAYFKPNPPQAQEDSDFDKNLEKYRAMKSEELPEEARKYKVQAFGAVDEKNFPHAAERFWKALKLAPWWSQGWFNLALTQAQFNDYPGAIASMKKYLKLEPNAPDARDAKDKIYQWEDK